LSLLEVGGVGVHSDHAPLISNAIGQPDCVCSISARHVEHSLAFDNGQGFDNALQFSGECPMVGGKHNLIVGEFGGIHGVCNAESDLWKIIIV